MMTAYHLLPLSGFAQLENIGSTPVAYELQHMTSISSVTFSGGQYQSFYKIQIIQLHFVSTAWPGCYAALHHHLVFLMGFRIYILRLLHYFPHFSSPAIYFLC